MFLDRTGISAHASSRAAAEAYKRAANTDAVIRESPRKSLITPFSPTWRSLTTSATSTNNGWRARVREAKRIHKKRIARHLAVFAHVATVSDRAAENYLTEKLGHLPLEHILGVAHEMMSWDREAQRRFEYIATMAIHHGFTPRVG